MYRFFRALTLTGIMLILMNTTAFAQTPAASPEGSPVSDTLNGLVEGATRQYTSDLELVPMENPDDFSVISVHVFRFETGDQAEAAWQSLRANAVDQLQPAAGSDFEPIDISEKEIDDLGDNAYAAWLSSSPMEGVIGHYRVLYVQDGVFLYLLTAIAGTDEDTLVTEDIARGMSERDAGSGPAIINTDGTSTGGIWDKFPDSDDESLGGLIAFNDRTVAVP